MPAQILLPFAVHFGDCLGAYRGWQTRAWNNRHPEFTCPRSAISKVGNVETPTMLMTGEADYRNPKSDQASQNNMIKR